MTAVIYARYSSDSQREASIEGQLRDCKDYAEKNGIPPSALCIRAGVPGHGPWRVPPFGNPRIEGRLRLPGAYRSLPRPSSTSDAKASAVRPLYLAPERGRAPPGD